MIEELPVVPLHDYRTDIKRIITWLNWRESPERLEVRLGGSWLAEREERRGWGGGFLWAYGRTRGEAFLS